MPSRRGQQLTEAILPALSVVLFLVAWEILVRWRGIAPIFLPAPSSVAVYLWRMLADGSMEYHLGVTLVRIFAGFLLAAVTGIALVLLLGMSRFVARIAVSWIAARYPFHKISLNPLHIFLTPPDEAYTTVT